MKVLSSCLLVLVGLLASGCGVMGDNGTAYFHVGSNWQKGVGIALGSTFPVTAERSDLSRKALAVNSALPTVVSMPGGKFQAVAAGLAQFKAVDGLSAVDTVEFNVVAPTAVALGAWWSNATSQPFKLAKKFALVQNGRYVGALVVEDAAGARLNHTGIVQVTCDHALVLVTDDAVEATPTTLGATTALVEVRDAAGAAKASMSYDVVVVAPKDIAQLKLNSATVQSGSSAPVDPDKGPVNPDPAASSSTAKNQIFLLAIDATLSDGTPVYGPPVAWSESSSGHLLTKQSNGGNYAVLKSGESVTVTATVGTLAAQIVLVAP